MMKYDQFLQLLGNAPGLKVLEATTHCDDLSEAIAEHVKACNGEFSVMAYPGDHTPIKAAERIKYTELNNFKTPFKASARDFEFIILDDVLHLHRFQEKLLRHTYQGLENSAYVIVIQSEGTMPYADVEAMLEKCEYRAGNTIKDLLSGATVTIAKKLHMWGNGM